MKNKSIMILDKKNVYNKERIGLYLNIILIISQQQCQHYLQYLLLMVGVQYYGFHKIVEKHFMVHIYIIVKHLHMYFI